MIPCMNICTPHNASLITGPVYEKSVRRPSSMSYYFWVSHQYLRFINCDVSSRPKFNRAQRFLFHIFACIAKAAFSVRVKNRQHLLDLQIMTARAHCMPCFFVVRDRRRDATDRTVTMVEIVFLARTPLNVCVFLRFF